MGPGILPRTFKSITIHLIHRPQANRKFGNIAYKNIEQITVGHDGF
jgi:hypothetical protein